MAIEADSDALVGSNETVLVITDEPTRASAALGAAAQRFMLVSENGQEYTPRKFRSLVRKGREDELYTPNYVSAVTQTDRGPCLYLDCKGEITLAMQATFIAILTAELHRHGIVDARIASA